MPIRVLSAHDVHALFSFEDGIDALSRAFSCERDSAGHFPDRQVTRLGSSSDDLQVLTMPGYLGREGPVVVKLSTIAPLNAAKNLPLIHATVAVLDRETGELLALVEGASLTALRTGAMSGLATKLLAREDSRALAVVGAGTQAKSQLAGVCAVRPIRQVFLHSRTRSRADSLASWLRCQPWFGGDVVVKVTAAEAVRCADVVCTATSTSSHAPLLEDEDIRPGMHFNAIGGVDEVARELPPRALRQGYVVVEQRRAALSEAGEIIYGIRQGAFSCGDLVEIGDIVAGHAHGRRAPQEVTVFKSVGLALQDAAIAELVYKKAISTGVGALVSLSGTESGGCSEAEFDGG